MEDFVNKLNTDDLWELLSITIKKLREQGQIRTRNITGERGEQLALSTYNANPELPNLQLSQENTRNIDAVSIRGERYSIKTVTYPNTLTGVFHGLGTPEEPINEQKFEYLIVVVIDENYQLKEMYEISWQLFLENIRWHLTMQAYNINLTNQLREAAKRVY